MSRIHLTRKCSSRRKAEGWMSRLAASPVHAMAAAGLFVFTLTRISAVQVFLYFQF